MVADTTSIFLRHLPAFVTLSKRLKYSAVKSAAAKSVRTPVAVELNPDGRVFVRLHVKPGAKQSQVVSYEHQSSVGLQVNSFCVHSQTPLQNYSLVDYVAAPPRDGEANDEVIRWLSYRLGLRPRSVELISGQRSRDKVVAVYIEDGTELDAERVQELLQP